ncbi:ATP-binding cassette domain-containing protein [Geminicoccus roseus]|uniref:ATP-binding cassette domain-containing protein n=1 Tax=Geminicoccus roseus TaxID=404900 RepID=UPI000412765E|nr:ATP-binding cassette domain-containing protein [Geminicoccus roseus]
MLTMSGVTKRYGETVALADAHVTFDRGHVHTILGENGSGKSTLVKLLSGVVRPSAGTIRLDDRPIELARPADAQRLGIATVFQEVLLAPARSVLENVFMGYDGLFRYRIDRAERRRRAEAALASVTRNPLDLDRPAGTVPLAQQQLIVLARALVREPRILILDEVTAALDFGDRDVLFEAIRAFVDGGRLALFISHRMDEVRRLSDRVTVLRSGSVVETLETGEITERRLLSLMLPDTHIPVGQHV